MMALLEGLQELIPQLEKSRISVEKREKWCLIAQALAGSIGAIPAWVAGCDGPFLADEIGRGGSHKDAVFFVPSSGEPRRVALDWSQWKSDVKRQAKQNKITVTTPAQADAFKALGWALQVGSIIVAGAVAVGSIGSGTAAAAATAVGGIAAGKRLRRTEAGVSSGRPVAVRAAQIGAAVGAGVDAGLEEAGINVPEAIDLSELAPEAYTGSYDWSALKQEAEVLLRQLAAHQQGVQLARNVTAGLLGKWALERYPWDGVETELIALQSVWAASAGLESPQRYQLVGSFLLRTLWGK